MKHKGDGKYCCVCCGTDLFKSDAKYDSGSGWPSFYEALDESKIKRKTDRTHGMNRTEVRCANVRSFVKSIIIFEIVTSNSEV